ncbi:MAG: hypothetical protein AAB668_01760 [Patescibacteria group bacterium]
MSEPLFVAGLVTLYVAMGVTLAGLSMRVWHRSDSVSLFARVLFPWNAYDRCVGPETGLSVLGELARHDLAVAYVFLLAFFWPLKLFWCLCTKFYVSFIYP